MLGVKLEILKSAPLLVQKVEPRFRIISGGRGPVSVSVIAEGWNTNIFNYRQAQVAPVLTLKSYIKRTNIKFYLHQIILTTWIKLLARTKCKSKYSRVCSVLVVGWVCRKITVSRSALSFINFLYLDFLDLLGEPSLSSYWLKKCWFWIMREWEISQVIWMS